MWHGYVWLAFRYSDLSNWSSIYPIYRGPQSHLSSISFVLDLNHQRRSLFLWTSLQFNFHACNFASKAHGPHRHSGCAPTEGPKRAPRRIYPTEPLWATSGLEIVWIRLDISSRKPLCCVYLFCCSCVWVYLFYCWLVCVHFLIFASKPVWSRAEVRLK